MKTKRIAALIMALAALAAPSHAATRSTLYFHSATPAGNAEIAADFIAQAASAGDFGPTMDANAPTLPAPKAVATTGGVGNHGFRKNIFGAYWSADLSGTISSVSVHFWANSAASKTVDIALFDQGAPGTATKMAEINVPITAGTFEYSANFGGLSFIARHGVVVQFFATPGNGAPASEAEILYDSSTTPSSVSFDYAPLTGNEAPLLDDPAALAFNGGTLNVSNAGSGQILFTDSAFKIAGTVQSGLLPGGFARGPAGLAFDGNGNRYVALPDSGEILQTTPSGSSGVYARGLGSPIGIAFDPSGNLWVADRAGRRLVRVAPDRSQAVAATFSSGAWGVALAPDGSITVSQSSGTVSKIDPSTFATSTLTTLTKSSAEGVAFDQAGTLYVGDGLNGRIVAVTQSGSADLKKGIGGPIALAFKPGTSTLVVATQSAGASGSNDIFPITASATGLSLAQPTNLGGPLPDIGRAWIHRSVAPDAIAPTFHTGAARPIDPATFTGALPSSDRRYTGAVAVEPMLGIKSNGHMFMTESKNPCSASDGTLVCGRTIVVRSNDNARTWSTVTPNFDQEVDMPPVSADPYMYVDRDTGRVFSVDLTSACNWVNYSDDEGATWTQNPLGCGEPPVDHQTMVAFKPRTVATSGYPNALMICSNRVADSPCQRSLDGGKTWLHAGDAFTQVPGVNECGGVITSHLWADKDGRLYLPRIGKVPCVSISSDDGATWTVHQVSSTIGGSGHEARITSDGANNLYTSWIGPDRLPYLSISRDLGTTWSTPKMVAPPGVTTANANSIAVGAAGRVVITYMGSTVDYGYTSRNMSKASWNSYITVSTNALDADPLFETTTANPLSEPVKRQDCGPDRCDLLFDFLNVQIGPDGRPWATFGDMCTGACATDRTYATGFVSAYGFVAPLVSGPNLLGDSALSPLAPTVSRRPGPQQPRSFGVSARNSEVNVYGATDPMETRSGPIGTDSLGDNG